MADTPFSETREVTIVSDNDNELIVESTGHLTAGGAVTTAAPSYSTSTNRQLSLNTSGQLRVETTSASANTRSLYSATMQTLTPAATPTDLVILNGSATKTIRLLKLELSGNQTTQSIDTFLLIKRSAANSGGTSTTPTVIPFDSTSAAGTGVFRAYSANPTVLGSSVGNLASARVYIPAVAATATGAVGYTWDFKQSEFLGGVVLRGTAEGLAVNFAGLALPGGLTLSITMTWSEE